MGKWKLFVGVTMVFVLGALAGGVGTKIYMGYQHPIYKRNSETRKTFLVNRLTSKLQLKPQQKKHIERVIDELTETLRKKRHESRLIIREHFDASFAEMKKVLTPAQQKKLAEMRGDYAKWRSKKRRPRRP